MTTAQLSTVNPAFAGHAAQQLREATDDLQRVFDNLLDIAAGNDPTANTYDRLRATRVLYDRGMGKVTRNTPRTPTHAVGKRPQNQRNPIITRITVQTTPDTPPHPTDPPPSSKQKLDDGEAVDVDLIDYH